MHKELRFDAADAVLVNEYGHVIARDAEMRYRGDGAELARRWNLHDALVSALADLHDAVKAHNEEQESLGACIIDGMGSARDALRLALMDHQGA